MDGSGALICNATITGIGSLGGSASITCNATVLGNGTLAVFGGGSANCDITVCGAGLQGTSGQGSAECNAAVTGIAIRKIATVTEGKVKFFEFGDKLYILNGNEYLVYDGTVCKKVEGYRPKVAISTPPAGGGTVFEQINVLTGAKHQTFSPDGTATAYQLAETNIDSADFVKINGELKAVDTDYTVDLINGKINFKTAPTGGTPNNVDIGWTKGEGQRNLIENCRFAMYYSGQTDSRVFLWGNKNFKNRRFWSGLADGTPSAEYFEANSYDDLGSGQSAITDIVKQFDRQKIFFENSAMYSYYNTETDSLGNTLATFPAFELNENVGNVAEGQVQIVNDNPFTLFKGVYAWLGSTVRDQTNTNLISQRIQNSLDSVDLSEAITYNWQDKKEYWLCIPSLGLVFIYNYLNDTWYVFDNIKANCFLVINGVMYFGTEGVINKFDPTLKADNEAAITAKWEMGFYDFNEPWLMKFMNNIWVGMNPEANSRVDVQYITDNLGTSETQTIKYGLLTFKHMDFASLGLSTSYNPQPFYLEVQAQSFTYLKIVLINQSLTEIATILSIVIPVRLGGKVR